MIKTIEFRLHEATLDSRVITVWATLVCNFVEACHDITSVDLVSLVIEHVHDRSYTVINLFDHLGMKAIADYYSQRGLYSHTYGVGEDAEEESRAAKQRLVKREEKITNANSGTRKLDNDNGERE